MALGGLSQNRTDRSSAGTTHRVTDLSDNHNLPEESPKVAGDGEPRSKRPKSSLSCIARQVSSEGLASPTGSPEKENKRKSTSFKHVRALPFRCVSRVASLSENELCSPFHDVPHLPNPLKNKNILKLHKRSVRLEAELHPLRLILARLMGNLTHNRRGIFNAPVDPIALGIPDYHNIIKKPMDLGTVKNRLHCLFYKSRQEVADDIRLCFQNAMRYNPPSNVIHLSAKELLAIFEDQLRAFCPELCEAEQGNYIDLTQEPDVLDNQTNVVVIDVENNGILDQSSSSNISPTRLSENATSPSEFSSRKTASTNLPGASSLATMTVRKRRKRGSKVNPSHNCQSCDGNVCAVCHQGCLQLEPTLLICNGSGCAGARIRKGATYYIAPDGSCQFCHRCYASLHAVLPHVEKEEGTNNCRYKRELLKRKNDEEVVEQWLKCVHCESSYHQICVMFNSYVHEGESFVCPDCIEEGKSSDRPRIDRLQDTASFNDKYTFISGSDLPVKLSDVIGQKFCSKFDSLSADSLPENHLSSFIEKKVRQRMISASYPNAEKTVFVRMISDCDRYFKVPEVIRNHFQSARSGTRITPPSQVHYRSKAIALFQTIDCLDVCIFCMYVHEYSGDDDFEMESHIDLDVQQKRVYIAYLDSVEHFRPRPFRTDVYQEILTSYLATARLRGFETAHIWACPPSRGNSFVFWNHPSVQKTPNMERLTSWYHSALSRAVACGIVTDVQSLYESDFETMLTEARQGSDEGGSISNNVKCPPLLEGDFWIEEALRIHSLTRARYVSSHAAMESTQMQDPPDDEQDPCPAIQVATMLRNKIVAHPSSLAFRRPVNAAALKLKDYHEIISKPMDFGTVLSRCLLGEYRILRDLVNDVELLIANAKKYNPIGHVVHTKAIEVNDLFFDELNSLTESWSNTSRVGEHHSWELFADMGMTLDTSLRHFDGISCMDSVSVVASEENAVISTSTSNPVGMSTDDPSVVSDDSSRTEITPRTRVQNTLMRPAVDIFKGGPVAIHHRMVGSDVWLLDKKAPAPSRKPIKRKKGTVDSLDEPALKKRRQTWLGEEVGESVRRMRTSLFRCSLSPSVLKPEQKDESLKIFIDYSRDYQHHCESDRIGSHVADARHALLELSQFRSFEFDTLRRAKYSSAMLLYHLHHDEAPGTIPVCSSCLELIEGVRWHRINKVTERRPNSFSRALADANVSKSIRSFQPEELCRDCYSKIQTPENNQYIPIPVFHRHDIESK